MARSLWLFNLLLVVVVLGFVGALSGSILDHWSLRAAPQTPPITLRPGTEVSKEEDPAPALRPHPRPLSDFTIILERDPFKNPVVTQPPKKPVVERPPPPLRLPALLGTIFVGDERKAILKDGNHEDIYRLGQPVAGGILAKIEVDRVVIKVGKRLAQILMKSAIRESQAEASPPAKAATPSRSSSRYSHLAQRSEERQVEPSEKMLRRREQLRRLRERFEQRRRSRDSQRGASR